MSQVVFSLHSHTREELESKIRAGSMSGTFRVGNDEDDGPLYLHYDNGVQTCDQCHDPVGSHDYDGLCACCRAGLNLYLMCEKIKLSKAQTMNTKEFVEWWMETVHDQYSQAPKLTSRAEANQYWESKQPKLAR